MSDSAGRVSSPDDYPPQTTAPGLTPEGQGLTDTSPQGVGPGAVLSPSGRTPSPGRIVVFYIEDTDAAEKFTHAIDYAQSNPYRPNPPDVKFGTPQERYSDEETNAWIIEQLRQAVPKVHLVSNQILPRVSAPARTPSLSPEPS